ncbi:GGDEF domain-containing protein [Kitasatospora sp. NBC_01302]|uniref:GGDEF domain-containing protein n=1 Tax=Kitasatospora sp. NBC_01302 TaxID=2903575 RepID=UPI002E1030AE|nr:diguanylate cyclase [Kitasatospora sp. NBC_01302]
MSSTTAVGQRIALWTAPEEVAARLGGDEFVVLARRDPHLQDRLTALRTTICAPVTHQGVSLTVGASLGTARVTRSHDLSAALGRADQKMYEARAEAAEAVPRGPTPTGGSGATTRRASPAPPSTASSSGWA